MPAAPAQKEKRHAFIINLPDWRRITAPTKENVFKTIRKNGNEPFAIVPISTSNVKFPRPRPIRWSRSRTPFPPPAPSARFHPRPCPIAVPRCGRARCPHRAAAPWRGARLGIEHTLRVLHAAALSAARCAAGPLIRRDVIIAPPLRTQYSHAHYPAPPTVGSPHPPGSHPSSITPSWHGGRARNHPGSRHRAYSTFKH